MSERLGEHSVPVASSAKEGTSRYGLSHAVRMEWTKLRTLRSTWWTLGATVAGSTAIAVAVGLHTKDLSGDLTNNSLAGVAPGLLLIGLLGVLTMTSEYSSGMIRSTLATIPNRPMVLAAKAAVFGLTALAAGELAAFVAFFAGSATLPARIPAPTLTQPHVLRAVVLSGLGLALVGLFGVGLGAIIRHSAAALCAFAGLVFVVAQLAGALSTAVLPYVPVGIVANSLGVTRSGPDALSPWAGLGMLAVYAAVSLGVGARLLTRRDA
jgi:ABC-2 type transport system permease protein